MNKNELLSRIKINKPFAELYFVLNSGDVRFVTIIWECQQDLARECLSSLEREIGLDISNNEDIPVYTSNDTEKSSVYRYDLPMSERLNGYAAIFAGDGQQYRQATCECITEADVGNVAGYLIRIVGVDQGSIGIFRKHAAVNTFKPARFMFMFNPNNLFERVDKPLIRVDSSADILWVDGEMFVMNLRAVESFDEVKKETKKKANMYVKTIEKSKLVGNIEKLNNLIEKDLAFARKLIRLFDSKSKVIELSPQKVFDYVCTHNKYRNRFSIVGAGKTRRFDLRTDANCRDFVTLLNDDFLKSELTGEDYEVVSKK